MVITIKSGTVDKTVYDRIGRFLISSELFFGDYDITNQILSNVLVIESKQRQDKMFEYIAVSPLFDIVEEGNEVPTYLVEFKYEEREIKFVKGGN